MLVETKPGSSPIISLATAGSSQAKNAVLLPITKVQPADPSAWLISSKISGVQAGSSSRPPRDLGRLSRNRPPACARRTRSAGIVPSRSPSPARARKSGLAAARSNAPAARRISGLARLGAIRSTICPCPQWRTIDRYRRNWAARGPGTRSRRG
jgi:hypothetical protein